MLTHRSLLILFILFSTTLIHVQCSSLSVPASNLDQLDLQGHRGARGLKPENTWPAFQAAIEHQMTTLELDTILTKDGHVIIHHDSETNPVICQKENGEPIQKTNLYNLTLAELKELDCGSLKNPNYPEQVPVPGTKLITIQEFFKLVATAEKKRKGQALKFNIETKFPNDEKATVSDERMKAHVTALVAAVEKAKVVNRTTIQSFYLPALPEVKKINPAIKTSALYAPTYFQGFRMVIGLGSGLRKDILESAEKLKADIISPYFLYVTPEFVFHAHKKNIQVIPWTVNDKKEMYRLIECGVDGIISDYPDRLHDTVKELQGKK